MIEVDHCLAHVLAGAQPSLDLVQFHPVTAELDLPVRAAPVLQLAGGQPDRPVPGAVQAFAALGRDEPLPGQLRVAEVAEGEAVAADEEVAFLTGLGRRAVGTHHVTAGVLQRLTDRHCGRLGRQVPHQVSR